MKKFFFLTAACCLYLLSLTSVSASALQTSSTWKPFYQWQGTEAAAAVFQGAFTSEPLIYLTAIADASEDAEFHLRNEGWWHTDTYFCNTFFCGPIVSFIDAGDDWTAFASYHDFICANWPSLYFSSQSSFGTYNPTTCMYSLPYVSQKDEIANTLTLPEENAKKLHLYGLWVTRLVDKNYKILEDFCYMIQRPFYEGYSEPYEYWNLENISFDSKKLKRIAN